MTKVFQFTFPHYEGFPPKRSKPASCLCIPYLVPNDLPFPILAVRHRYSLPPPTAVSVPETTVDENCHAAAREDYVWLAGKVLAV